MTSRSLSCTSFSFPLLPLGRVIELIGMLDLDGVDLCIADGDREVQAGEVLIDPDGAAERHRRMCAAAGLAVLDVFAHLGTGPFDRPINTPDDHLRRSNRHRLIAYLRYAAAVGSPGLTLSPGHKVGPDGFDRAVHELQWVVQAAADCGVTVGVEPHMESVAESVDAAVQLCAAVPGLRLTVDYSHFIAQEVAQTEVNRLFAHASHAHLRQAAPGRLQCPADEGVIDVAAVLAAASAHGFTGTIALEYVHSPRWGMNRLDVLSETIRMRDLVRSLAE